ncbi:MAG: B12-binding domain-containing radical SAM protein [Burkholderiales bacterium]
MEKPDIAIVFPPQWSPFQPPLSLPALAGWLGRAGYIVDNIDANIWLFHWLYSTTAVDVLGKSLGQRDCPARERQTHRAILHNSRYFYDDLMRLIRIRDHITNVSPTDLVTTNYIAVQSLGTYLNTVSYILDGFSITPFEFRVPGGAYRSDVFVSLVDNPPRLFDVFSDLVVDRILRDAPRTVGLSCIGQEQLFFTLLIGRKLKRRSALPVIIGGTILSRIFERGVVPAEWFGCYFDVIVRHEGEIPCERILANVRAGEVAYVDVPDIVYKFGGEIMETPPSGPLPPEKIPTPDFRSMPLRDYISAQTTLPLLASRGCYWGKCEFCHHGMVYGEKYTGYRTESVVQTIMELSNIYGVRQFAFNDEAIPPKVLRRLSRELPDCEETGFAFTGLIKFEDFYSEEDFAGARNVGFRSLYVGLESFSENVLRLMRKPTPRFVIERNLADARRHGIWMHCFLFFGFPGETDSDALDTFNLVMSRDDIVSSFGCATFSLEHNAPIMRNLDKFGVRLTGTLAGDLDVYYEYCVSSGIGPVRAAEWMSRLNRDSRTKDQYFSSWWIPREHLLGLLAHMSPEQVVCGALRVQSAEGLTSGLEIARVLSVGYAADDRAVDLVIRVTGEVFSAKGRTAEVLVSLPDCAKIAVVAAGARSFYDHVFASLNIRRESL